jgi:hypothetical protein
MQQVSQSVINQSAIQQSFSHSFIYVLKDLRIIFERMHYFVKCAQHRKLF